MPTLLLPSPPTSSAESSADQERNSSSHRMLPMSPARSYCKELHLPAHPTVATAIGRRSMQSLLRLGTTTKRLCQNNVASPIRKSVNSLNFQGVPRYQGAMVTGTPLLLLLALLRTLKHQTSLLSLFYFAT